MNFAKLMYHQMQLLDKTSNINPTKFSTYTVFGGDKFGEWTK